MSNSPPLRRARLGFWGLWNLSFGFFGIQVGFALQNANVSRIFQTLGASVDDLPILWIAGPATGLIVQPIIGHLSDRTWGRLGRRRPYFLVGACLCTFALILFPSASILWAAAGLMWMLDASINISMEPFRAFVGDMTDTAQRTAGYALQTVFIGAGAVAASVAPALLTSLGVPNTAPAGQIPPSVAWAFYLGAGALFFTVMWTVITTREYPPEIMAGFDDALLEPERVASVKPSAGDPLWLVAGAVVLAAIPLLGLDKPLYVLGVGLAAFGLARLLNQVALRRGRADTMLNHLLSDLAAMPPLMRRLAKIQFLSWSALFILWIYATPIVTRLQFGAMNPASRAYQDGADWVGVLFAIYNGVAALYAFALPPLVKRIGAPRLHAINLVAGAAGYATIPLLRDANLLLLPMIGIGMAWASILTIPYSLLAGAIPARKLGVYMGLFNIFVVLPQLMVSSCMGSLARAFFPDATQYCFIFGAALLVGAALLSATLVPRAARSSAGPVGGCD
jgi:maltose/moltooligosaccharide transporter